MQDIMIKLRDSTVQAARAKAKEDRRSLEAYITFLVEREIAGPEGVVLSLTASNKSRDFFPTVVEGESKELVNQRNAVMNAFFKAADH